MATSTTASAPPVTGFYGKLPACGDFVRRALPPSFIVPWDQWLREAVEAAERGLGRGFGTTWDRAPAWRFVLPAGTCGAQAVAGVLIPSRDAGGRRFPLTLAALLAPGAGMPPPEWFDRVEGAGRGACARAEPPDALLSELPLPVGGPAHVAGGWWRAGGPSRSLSRLPPPSRFGEMLLGLIDGRGPCVTAATHPGVVRERNEDAFVVRSDIGLWAVIDGAGGHGAGEEASSTIADVLGALDGGLGAADVLAQVRAALEAAHGDLGQRGRMDPRGRLPAATAVVLMARDGHFAGLWAGDARLYLLRDGTLEQLSHDHSVLQELLDAGLIDATQTRHHPQANVITRAVGAPDVPLELDKISGELLPGDRFMLCSDGVSKALEEEAIARSLADGCDAQALVDAALAADASDNVTAMVVGW